MKFVEKVLKKYVMQLLKHFLLNKRGFFLMLPTGMTESFEPCALVMASPIKIWGFCKVGVSKINWVPSLFLLPPSLSPFLFFPISHHRLLSVVDLGFAK